MCEGDKAAQGIMQVQKRAPPLVCTAAGWLSTAISITLTSNNAIRLGADLQLLQVARIDLRGDLLNADGYRFAHPTRPAPSYKSRAIAWTVPFEAPSKVRGLRSGPRTAM
jgi:hypothetical protein